MSCMDAVGGPVVVVGGVLKGTHRLSPFLTTQASSNGLGLLVLSVQEDVPLPQLQHQRSGPVGPLQRLRGRGSG